ncbi:MAG: hypothetical protein JWQ39_2495 [Glaciihabitans sp.]|nr:hypothetical protein [Glaciihabitans sp.]
MLGTKFGLGSKGIIVLAVAAILAATTGVLSASASTTVGISGTLSNDGSLIQYGTYRYNSGGAASFNCTNSVGLYNGQDWFKLGLRNTANVQITDSPSWDSSGQTRSFHTTAGSSSIPYGHYAINGRMGEHYVIPNDWAGNLTW